MLSLNTLIPTADEAFDSLNTSDIMRMHSLQHEASA